MSNLSSKHLFKHSRTRCTMDCTCKIAHILELVCIICTIYVLFISYKIHAITIEMVQNRCYVVLPQIHLWGFSTSLFSRQKLLGKLEICAKYGQSKHRKLVHNVWTEQCGHNLFGGPCVNLMSQLFDCTFTALSSFLEKTAKVMLCPTPDRATVHRLEF